MTPLSNPTLERTPLAGTLFFDCGIRPRPESSLSLHPLGPANHTFMLLKALLWLLTLLGLLPVALIATAFYYIGTNLRPEEASDPAGQPVQYSARTMRHYFFRGPSVFYLHSLGIGRATTPVYFRPWAVVIGIVGALCLIIFAVFTFHIPPR